MVVCPMLGYHRGISGAGADKPMAEHPESILEGKNRPFTGAEFLQSLRDGRELYIYGERVKDVTTHPAFRNAAASVAKLYDALHAPKSKEVLTAPTDTGSGGYTHRFFKVARSREDVIAQRDAIANGRVSPTAGWAAARITRPNSSTHLGPMRSSTASSPVTRVPGTSAGRRPCSTSTTPWSTRLSTATSRWSRSRTSTSPSRRRPTPASMFPAPRCWPPTRR